MSGTVGSLFSGCLGLDLGLEAAGWRTAWACENDEACRRLIARKRPELEVIPDVREIDAGLPAVDLLAGGFPCQDLSYAGRGAGLDGDRSGLWFEFARAIRVLRPRLVLVENVPGLATRGLGRVLYDLAEAGYVGSWLRLGASDLGAPHRRERIFIVAADAGWGGVQRWSEYGGVPRAQAPRAGEGLQRQRGRDEPGDDDQAAARGGRPRGVEGAAAADAGGERRPRWGGPDSSGTSGDGQHGRASAARPRPLAADTYGSGLGQHRRPVAVGAQHATAQHGGDGVAADAERGRRPRGQAGQRGDLPVGAPAEWQQGDQDAALDAAPQPAADASGEPRQPGGGGRAEGGAGARPGQAQRDGHRLDGQAEPRPTEPTAADADGPGREAERAQRGRGAAQPGDDVGDDGPRPSWGPYEPAIWRWEAVIGRPAPRPTDARGRLNPEFVEWMLGFPDGWTAGERRTHRLRMLGNSVQVQCAEYIGAILMDAHG